MHLGHFGKKFTFYIITVPFFSTFILYWRGRSQGWYTALASCGSILFSRTFRCFRCNCSQSQTGWNYIGPLCGTWRKIYSNCRAIGRKRSFMVQWNRQKSCQCFTVQYRTAGRAKRSGIFVSSWCLMQQISRIFRQGTGRCPMFGRGDVPKRWASRYRLEFGTCKDMCGTASCDFGFRCTSGKRKWNLGVLYLHFFQRRKRGYRICFFGTSSRIWIGKQRCYLRTPGHWFRKNKTYLSYGRRRRTFCCKTTQSQRESKPSQIIYSKTKTRCKISWGTVELYYERTVGTWNTASKRTVFVTS